MDTKHSDQEQGGIRPRSPTPLGGGHGGHRTLLGIAEVCRRTGRSRSTIGRYVLDLELGFPQPVRLGERDRGWYADELEEWISSRPRVRTAQ